MKLKPTAHTFKLQRLLRHMIFLVVMIMVAAILFNCNAIGSDTVTFLGDSMLPTLKNGEKIHIKRFDKGTKPELKRGDILVFLYPKDTSKFYIKRLIGLPNETVEIRDSKVFIDGKELSEPYVDPKLNKAHRSQPPVYVTEHFYYVLGDNRDNSNDSRFWGLVSEEFMLAKAVDR